MEPTISVEKYFKKITAARVRALDRLAVRTVRDMLYHFPARYVTAAETRNAALEGGTTATLTGTVEMIRKRMTHGKKRMMITEATLLSDGKKVRAVWFHQPYIARQYAVNDTVRISGKIAAGEKPYFTNPIITKVVGKEAADGGTDVCDGKEAADGMPNGGTDVRDGKEAADGGTDVPAGDGWWNAEPRKDAERDGEEGGLPLPVYPETKGVSTMWLSRSIRHILDDRTMVIDDPLTDDIRKKVNLPEIRDAFMLIHQPKRNADHAVARKRFIFEKVFAMRVAHLRMRHVREGASAYPLLIDTERTDAFMRDSFEFTPTDGQRKAVREILSDLRKNRPMARLLEGDVGSGKTAVAAAAVHAVVTARHAADTPDAPQVAYLAPTEVLARQQFRTLARLYGNLPVSVGLITGRECVLRDGEREETVSKVRMKRMIADGTVSVTVGTHAVIQKDVRFSCLTLIIIDEQHRFGVAQRETLLKNQTTHTPHLLSMTATPIPRTVALTVYGDLDISTMEDMPEGRRAVKTRLVRSDEKNTVYAHIRAETEKGHQAYILCPRIGSDAESPLRSLEEEYESLKKDIFPDLTVGMLHAKLKPDEKKEVMERFSSGEIRVLVCTTVVEVGVNVPNATIIAILHAERFGLAQLHQLRGRVIRSSHQPHCYAVTDSVAEPTLERLKFFEKEHDGFTLARYDFSARGSGEINGLRQSGVPDLVAEGLRNGKLMQITRTLAKAVIDADPTLRNHEPLRRYIEGERPHPE